jgi:hypothetical protein
MKPPGHVRVPWYWSTSAGPAMSDRCAKSSNVVGTTEKVLLS